MVVSCLLVELILLSCSNFPLFKRSYKNCKCRYSWAFDLFFCKKKCGTHLLEDFPGLKTICFKCCFNQKRGVSSVTLHRFSKRPAGEVASLTWLADQSFAVHFSYHKIQRRSLWQGTPQLQRWNRLSHMLETAWNLEIHPLWKEHHFPKPAIF